MQVSSSLSCPLRCIPPARIVANTAVRRLIQRLRVRPAELIEEASPQAPHNLTGVPYSVSLIKAVIVLPLTVALQLQWSVVAF